MIRSLKLAIIFAKISAMKKILFLTVLLASLVACRHITGSGNIVTDNRTTSDFTGISVAGAFEVEVNKGPATEVRVEADDNLIRYIKTDVSGNELRIRLENNYGVSDAHLKVYVTTPLLLSIKASSASDVTVNGIMTSKEKLRFQASSAAVITADIDAPEVEASASSAATLKLNGRTMIYTANSSSGADIRTSGLLSEKTKVTSSSGASAYVHASVNLEAHASSGATIYYRGAGNVQKNISSGGNVERRD
jgi:hypothetical protein